MSKMSLNAIITGFIVRSAVGSALSGLFFMCCGSFMVMLGTPSYLLGERFYHSPLGAFLNAVAVWLASVAFGYTIGLRAKHAPFFNITMAIVLEHVVSMLAVGLNVPGYAHVRLHFLEMVTSAIAIGLSYGGVFLIGAEHVVFSEARQRVLGRRSKHTDRPSDN